MIWEDDKNIKDTQVLVVETDVPIENENTETEKKDGLNKLNFDKFSIYLICSIYIFKLIPNLFPL